MTATAGNAGERVLPGIGQYGGCLRGVEGEDTMDEKDRLIQRLTRELEKWKKMAVEAAEKACFECESLNADCSKCKMTKIKEAAGKA